MKNRYEYSFQDDLKKRLQDPEFAKAWKESELEYQLAAKLIENRLAKKISQRQLAKKAKTTQAVICRIETLQENPSLSLLKRLAKALDSELVINFKPLIP